MKNKRRLALFMILMLVLTGCGGEQKDGPDRETKKKKSATETELQDEAENEAESEAEEGDSTGEAEETAGEDAAEKPEESEQKNVEPLVTVIDHAVVCEIEGKKRATGCYPEIVLSDEYAAAWPKLGAVIDAYNTEWKEQIETAVSTYAAWAEASANDEYGLGPDACFSSDLVIEVRRADEHLFSMLCHGSDFSGGAHPLHGTSCINLDPVSGQEVPLSQVLQDTTGMSAGIYAQLRENYPDVADEVSSYAETGDAATKNAEEVFDEKLVDDTYTWTVEDGGLYLWFSPYEIASYAAGYSDAALTYEEFPNLVQPAYRVKHQDGWVLPVKKEEAGPEQVEVDPNLLVETISVSNPSWDYYCSPEAKPAAKKHITLTKTMENPSDWLNTDVWCEEHGFVPASGGVHEDENYRYVATNPLQYDYMFSELEVYEAGSDKLLYHFDLQNLILGPDEQTGTSSRITQYLRWSKIIDDTLYVSVGHNTYADSEPKSSYVAAIDINTGNVLWKTKPLTSNAWNFQIVDDTIICGYGFTDEPDYIYLLDRFTGEQLQQIWVRTGPDQFEIVGDTLYVATYNTAYEFTISR